MFWYVQKLGPSACFRSYRRRLDKWWHTDITICLPLLSKDKSNLKKMREISDKIFWHGYFALSHGVIHFARTLSFEDWLLEFAPVRKKFLWLILEAKWMTLLWKGRKQWQWLSILLLAATWAFGRLSIVYLTVVVFSGAWWALFGFVGGADWRARRPLLSLHPGAAAHRVRYGH